MLEIKIIGRVGSDAVIKDHNGNKFICFDVAYSKTYKDANNNKVEKSVWVSCTKNGDSNIVNYLKKGTQVYISGEPIVRAYLSNTNQPLGTLNCRVRDIKLLSQPKQENKEVQAPQESVQTQTTQVQSQQPQSVQHPIGSTQPSLSTVSTEEYYQGPTTPEDDDLPF